MALDSKFQVICVKSTEDSCSRNWLSLNSRPNKMSVCKTVMPPYYHINIESETVHKMISEELIMKYQCHLRKERGKTPKKKKIAE